MAPHLITIPGSDRAFRAFASRSLARHAPRTTDEFERRLRRIYPRALVRERGLAGEAPAWYVYREGVWRAPTDGSWWDDPAVPRLVVSSDGWVEEANATALGILGIEPSEVGRRHFTDFVVAGALDDAIELLEIVREAGSLDAGIVLQPTSGDAIAVDIRADTAASGEIVAFLRLTPDIDGPVGPPRQQLSVPVSFHPRTDVAFRAYGERALSRMPEPTPDGLALRLRRLYPHANVEAGEEAWVAQRDRTGDGGPGDSWWEGPGLACVRYDSQALILEANEAAVELFGRPLVGHHWQEFVTAGSTDEVAVMLEILADVGAAESRFRIPRGDGGLLEFDSYTVVQGEAFETVFRPVRGAAAAAAQPGQQGGRSDL